MSVVLGCGRKESAVPSPRAAPPGLDAAAKSAPTDRGEPPTATPAAEGHSVAGRPDASGAAGQPSSVGESSGGARGAAPLDAGSAPPSPQPARRVQQNEVRELRAELSRWLPNHLHELELDGYEGQHLALHLGRVHEVVLGTEHVLVVPVRVEGRCRLALVTRNDGAIRLVPVAEGASYWGCASMTLWSTLDVNGDGVADFAFALSVPSNRYDAMVGEGALYLSDVSRRTYCHADVLTSSSYMGIRKTPEQVQRKLAEDVAWLGPQIVDCKYIEAHRK